MRTLLTVGVALSLAACAEHTTNSAFPTEDASASSRDSDLPDGPFACGQTGMMCDPSQYCVLGCSGNGPIGCAPLLDSGACPSGYALPPVARCPGDAAPCAGKGVVYPTMCIDDLDGAACPYPGAVGPRTFECHCPI